MGAHVDHRLSLGRPSRETRSRSAPRLLALLAGVVAAACLGPVRGLHPPGPGETAVTVHVVRHGWHSGLVMPREVMGPDAGRPDAAPFVEVGWGDRAFYQNPDAGVGRAVKAALASAGSVLHVTGLARPPAAPMAGVDVVAVRLSARGAEALARFVSDAYARDAAGQPIDLGPGVYPGSRFYAATGRYSLLYTCNTWIADALRAAGCPITPAWALTASNLIAQTKRCAPDTPRR